MAAPTVGASAGVAFLVSYEAVSSIIAKACSSPQTTELNASTRAETLMKWVNIGGGEAALVVGVAAVIDPKARPAILWGGFLALAITYAEYLHARQAGLASNAPGTEMGFEAALEVAA